QADPHATSAITKGNAMTDRHDSSRRRALAQLSAGSLATLAPWALQSALAQAKPLTVGVIYVGPRDDFGYNQAQAQAAAEIKKLPGIKVVEEENVPETTAVQKTMTGMIQQDGAKVASPTSLADRGVDVFTMHVDGPKVVVETAAKRGKMVCGYHASQAKLAPNAYLTGAEWNWLTAYKTVIDAAQSGKPHPNFLRGGLKEGY